MKRILSACGMVLVLLAFAAFVRPEPPNGRGSVPAMAGQTMPPRPASASPLSMAPHSPAPALTIAPVAYTPYETFPSVTPTITPTPALTATAMPSASPKPPKPSATKGKAEKTKVAYLTFDDGPVLKGKKPTNGTANLLKILKKHNIKATFFLIGQNVQAYPELAKSIVKDGHVLGNHTWSHVDALKVTGGTFAWQVKHTNDVIYKVTGVRPKLFRPPYGRNLDGSQWGTLKRNGLKAFWWNVDTRDWAGNSDKKILGNIAYNIRTNKDDLIILFHDHSFSALEEAIDMLDTHGYVFDTLDHVK